MTRPTSVLTAGVRLILGCLVVGTLAGFSQSRHVAAPPLGYVLGVVWRDSADCGGRNIAGRLSPHPPSLRLSFAPGREETTTILLKLDTLP